MPRERADKVGAGDDPSTVLARSSVARINHQLISRRSTIRDEKHCKNRVFVIAATNEQSASGDRVPSNMKETPIAYTISPINGWMLDLTVALDAHNPGFAGAYLRASNERRQVIAAYCAKVVPDEAAFPTTATFLSTAGHKSILQSAFGDVPVGLRGVLGRAGSQPHDRRFYTTLHKFLAEPRHPAMATAIRRIPKIDFARLRILNMLPPDICAPTVVELVGDIMTAKDVVRLFELLVCSGVDREALARALRSLTDSKQMSKFWDRWVSDCPLPSSPLDQLPLCRPVRTAGALFSLARRYRNCAARYAPEALEGGSAFGEMLPSGGRPGMVVHLRRKRGVWTIDGLFLRQNGRPDPGQREEAYALLAQVGVKLPERAAADEGEWSSLRRLTFRPWDFEAA